MKPARAGRRAQVIAPSRAAASAPAHDPRWVTILVAVVAASCVVFSVSFQIFDTDLWQHLVRGKATLATGAIPTTNIWTWPTYGSPERGNAAWLFALLIWPFWSLGGVTGLFVWRWLMVLAAFAVVWAIARKLGARGVLPLVVMVACAMFYRPRSQVRPETLACLLIALETWILEVRRRGGPDRSLLLVPLAWLWPNVHMSFYVGWIVLGIFALFGSAGGPRRISLWWILAAQVVVTLLNPLGTEVFRLPYEFFTSLRKEPLYTVIGELKPIDWSINWMNGLPLLMAAWPALVIWRWRRGRGDVVEALLCLLFTAWAFSAQRFLTFWAVVAAPYIASGVSEWWAGRRSRKPMSAGLRVAFAAAACVALVALEHQRSGFAMGVAIDPHSIPTTACDFMAREGVRGRGFNYFEQGGYLLWRFWPDRERLPFMTTAPELATPAIRLAYQRAMVFERDWRLMDERHHFDWVLLRRIHERGDRYLDIVDGDSTFALVFLDDVSGLYVKRGGRLQGVAERFAYRMLPGGQARFDAVVGAATSSPEVGEELRRELDRAIGASPLHSSLETTRSALLGRVSGR